MARAGLYDLNALLDLDMEKVDKRQGQLQPWAPACGPVVCWQPMETEESRMFKTDPEREWKRRKSSQVSDGIIMGLRDYGRRHSAGSIIVNPCIEEPVLLYPNGQLGSHSLQVLVPNLLRGEVEVALEKLGHVCNRAYAWNMFLEMMRSQARSCYPNSDLPLHFTGVTRHILVDWVIRVHEMMTFEEDTLYLAIHLLNRSLQQITFSTSNLQLVAMVCLFLAAKKEECLLPEVSGLCYLMDHAYTKHQLLRMERKIFSGLKFDLSHSSPLNFLFLFATIARCSPMVKWMARYLLELSLLESRCLEFPPAQLAAAALYLARRVLQGVWRPEEKTAWFLVSSIPIGSEADLLKIMHILASAAAKAHNQESCASFTKFSSPEAMYVSRHPGLLMAQNLLS